MEQKNPITQGSLLPAFLKFSMPLLLAFLLQSMYGAVDLLVVGRFCDAAGVSAVSIGTQIAQTLTNLVAGLSMGATVLLGQHIGAQDGEAAAKTLGTTVWLFGGIALLMSAVQIAAAAPFAAAMNAPAEAFADTVLYVRICGGGMVFVVAYNTLSGVLRGMGDAKLPLVLVAIACGVNIAGDLLLVGPLHMGAAGAAIATVAAQGVSVALAFPLLRRRGLPFAFRRAQLRVDRAIFARILKTGAPVALQSALTNLSFLILGAILNGRGVVVSAGVGVAEKVCNFIMLVPMSFMSALSAFVAQNIGANKPARANRAMAYSIGLSLAFGACMFVPAFFFGESLTGIFSADAAVVAAGAQYLQAYAIDCILVAFVFSFTGYFNGCGKTMFVMAQGLAASFVVRAPLAYLISRLPGATLFHIGLATPVSSVFSIAVCGVYFFALRRKGVHSLVGERPAAPVS